MSVALLVAQNLRHKARRVFWTVLAVALVTVCLLLLRTVSAAWSASMEERRDDRVAVWNRTTYALTLPKGYVDELKRLDGVKATTYSVFFEAHDPHLAESLQGYPKLAVDDAYFDVYPEARVDPVQLRQWKADRQGALISEKLSRSLGYKVGDLLTLEGRNFPGTWKVRISGIYRSNVKTFADNVFLLHWDYLNNGLPAGDPRKDQISWMMSLVDYGRSMEIAKAIDAHFAPYSVETQSMTEKSMVGMFMANFSSALDAINFISVVLVAIAALILGNAVIVTVRERTFQLGVLRALGFANGAIFQMALWEAAIVGALGGLLGVMVAYALLDFGVAGEVENSMGTLFPTFGVPPSAAVTGIVLPALIGMAATVLPTMHALRGNIVHTLRGVE